METEKRRQNLKKGANQRFQNNLSLWATIPTTEGGGGRGGQVEGANNIVGGDLDYIEIRMQTSIKSVLVTVANTYFIKMHAL